MPSARSFQSRETESNRRGAGSEPACLARGSRQSGRWAREESNLSSAAYHAAALPLCYAPIVLRPGIEPRPRACPAPTRAYKTRCSTTSCRSACCDPGGNRTRPHAVDSGAASARCVRDQMRLPGEIRTPSAAFGGLRPIHSAGRSAFAPLHQGQGSNLQLPRGGWLTATWLAIRLTLVWSSPSGLHRARRRYEGRLTARSRSRNRPAGPHRGASPAGVRAFRVPRESRTRLSGLEDRVLAARTAVRFGARTGNRTRREHLARVSRPRSESNRLVPGLQSGAFPFGDLAVSRRRSESNARGRGPAA